MSSCDSLHAPTLKSRILSFVIPVLIMIFFHKGGQINASKMLLLLSKIICLARLKNIMENSVKVVYHDNVFT
jgi:hypothetical protein